MSRLQKIERRIDGKLRDMLRSSSPDQRRELVEVHRAILDEVASRVETLPRAKSSFSYSQVLVQVLTDPERRRSYELVFTEADALERGIKRCFNDQGVEFARSLKVGVDLVDDLPADLKARGFDVSYSNAAASAPSSQPIPIRLTILAGSAEQTQYCFTKPRINIGRLLAVLDAQLRPVRRNDVALKDQAAGPNSSVSRTHAHLEFDPEASRFRLFDDGSAHGTSVIREGCIIQVPKGASKGVPLVHEDEIIIGQVHLRFEHAQSG
jgi:hypothetical protein